MRPDMIKQLDGYEDVLQEIEVSRKYGLDIDTDKGSAADYIRRLHPAVIDLKVSSVSTEITASSLMTTTVTNITLRSTMKHIALPTLAKPSLTLPILLKILPPMWPLSLQGCVDPQV